MEQTSRRAGERLQDASQGVGPAYQRRYMVRVTDCRMDAAQLIDRLASHLNAASPAEVAVFEKTAGDKQGVAVDDEYVIHMPGPWNGPVRVVERTRHSFRFATLKDHMEAGEIEFRAADAGEGDLVFTIESWARSGDRLANVLYDRLRLSKEMQLHMWTHFCSRVSELAGGRISGHTEVYTKRVPEPGDHAVRQLATRATIAVFASAFFAAARLRRGRPLHPRGLVLDATLRLHGTSRPLGVGFLDDHVETRGVARLSRAAGLPPALPDVLGLALRWRQPAHGGIDTDADAELLLATTGHGRLGRRLLRPRTRWAPAFYGSLLPYEAGDRRMWLGAVTAESETIAADTDTLARAVRRRPLLLDLVVATGLGRWERFGEITLALPSRREHPGGAQPLRFDPARYPIPELRPAGLLQQVRGPSYAAAQQVPARTHDPVP